MRIDLAADAATTGTLRVSYVVRGARWVPIYDARLDTGGRDRKPAPELVRRAEIVQQTGEDWIDVALSASTVRTAKGGAAPDLRSLIVRFDEPKVADGFKRDQDASRGLARTMAPAAAPIGGLRVDQDYGARNNEEASTPAQERETTLETGGFQAVFRVPGRVSVIAQEGAKSFRIATATILPDLLVRAVPALDPTAYLEASFKHAEEAPLLPGRVALYRNGTFVGRVALALAVRTNSSILASVPMTRSRWRASYSARPRTSSDLHKQDRRARVPYHRAQRSRLADQGRGGRSTAGERDR